MRRLVRAAIFVVPLALVSAAAAACGGGGGALSLDEYFAELQKLDQAQDQKQNDVEAQYEEKLNATEFSDQVIDDYTAFFEESRAAAQEFLDRMRDLDAPDEAAEAHDSALAAYDGCLEQTGKVVDQIGEAQSFDDLLALFQNEDVNQACDRTTTACENLQAIADENDVEVDLNCGDA
jgi:hypothetical protein